LSGSDRLVSVGRVGRAHGRDGSFYVEGAEHRLDEGLEVELAGRRRRVERRAGSDERPLVRLTGLEERGAAVALRGELLLVSERGAPLEEGEWLAGELVGLRVEGLGRVRRVLEAPSCAVLELDDGTLVPLVSDAVRAVRRGDGTIEVDLQFLGVER
jgi:16S rRNA processing protein RimM